MSVLRRIAEPVRAPVRRVISHYHHFFEDLIHAIKSELVDRFDRLDGRFGRLDDSVATSHTAISDQLAMQGASIRAIEAELERLQELTTTGSAELHHMIEAVRGDAAVVLADVGGARDELAAARKDLSERIAHAAPSVRLRELIGSRLDDIDGPASGFLNYAYSHNGPLADAGLWINHPVVVEWQEGRAQVGAVNERIIEQPFVFAAVADLTPGSRILDIGGGESTVGFSLASLGYEVTVIEPQGYPFEHPNLRVWEHPLEDFPESEPFDAVILLSTIEHFGIGHYAGGPEPNPDADLEAMASVAALTAPDGRLILTTPYGRAETNSVERVYDRARLLALLEGWAVRYVAIGRQSDDRRWQLEANELLDVTEDGNRVAMLVATPPTAPAPARS